MSLFAELFNEMLMRDFAFRIYRAMVEAPDKNEEVRKKEDKNDEVSRKEEVCDIGEVGCSNHYFNLIDGY